MVFCTHEAEGRNKSSKTPPVPAEDCEVKGSVQAWAYFYLRKGYSKLIHVEGRLNCDRD